MEIKFFPYDFEYKVKEDETFIYLYGKLENNSKICVIEKYRPYFYAQVSNIHRKQLNKRLSDLQIEDNKKIAKVTSYEECEKELLGKKKDFWKIYVNYPKAVPIISKELSQWGLECYEKDILYTHRYLRDREITPFTLVQAKGDFIDENRFRVPVFLAEEIKQFSKDRLKNVKLLSIDIETYSKNKIIQMDKNPILMIAFYGRDEKGKEFKKVITWKKFSEKKDYLEFVNDEIDLLNRFRQIMIDYNPDILTGYFSDGFDLPYIKTRAEKYKIKMDLGLDYSEIYTGSKYNNNNLSNATSKIKGILHLDIFKFIRNIFGKNLKTESYSLNAVSNELIGNSKHDIKIEKLADTWDNHPEKLIDFCEYNLHDAHLALQLFEKLFFDIIEFTKIIGLPSDDIIRMRFSKLVESYILQRAKEYNVIAPNKPAKNEIEQRFEETYEGGFVYEPTPGLYEDLIVFDFRSLYPTIITAHNIGPEALNCDCCDDKEKVPGKDNYWFCTRKKSFLSKVLERIILRRVDLKRLIKESNEEEKLLLESRSYALKVLANSFYGYMAFFGARWYCIECAKSTTAYARDYIQSTIKKAEEKQFQVVYADTDSCFLLLGDQIMDQAMEFMNEINFNLPGHMELEFEGYYPKGLFVALKGKEGGAKKKYALITKEGTLKITGFETVRRNWSPISKEVQQNVLRMVLEDKKEEALEYIKEMISKLKSGKISKEDLIIKTQITKDLRSYSSIGPHVAVALKMLEKDIPVGPGTIVEYIITKGSGLIRERAKMLEEVKQGEYDADYYLNNQLIPAVSSIFLVLGYNEEDLLGEGKQEGLGKFF
jgi:DNA polymerase, archaea type